EVEALVGRGGEGGKASLLHEIVRVQHGNPGGLAGGDGGVAGAARSAIGFECYHLEAAGAVVRGPGGGQRRAAIVRGVVHHHHFGCFGLGQGGGDSPAKGGR